MKFSYNWISELVSGVDAPPKELSRLITMKTAESEGVERYGAHLACVAVAKVLEVEPIPGSHNGKAVVDAGPYGRRTVVCGAPNCRAGMSTIYVPSGTALGAIEIATRTIDGVESDGMLASGAELGVNRDHEGILDLPAGSFDLWPDAIIEIDNKSLTHRPDLWGHYGMAREVVAITKVGQSSRPVALLDPVKLDLLPTGPAAVKIEVPDYNLCPRYSALVFENVTVQPSPLWLQYRLEAIGLNPINNIVDVTNFIMAELAQPMHAFDADKLTGDTIYVRPAREGETILALNDEPYDLTPANLVIADASGPIAIAGVIGGAASAISNSTTRIVFESANFQAASVRRTSAALKLRTDASMRFEKAQDPENTVRALARAVELLEQVSPGIRVVGGVADACRPNSAPPPILLPLEWLSRKLGRALTGAEVRLILESLEFGVEETEAGVFSITVPSWRATKDISIKDDLVEEVGRMIGYDSIAPRPPLVAASVPPSNDERAFHHRVRSVLVDQGFTEVYNYSFISDAAAAELGFDPAAHARVANPIAADQNLMRSTLLAGILKNIRENSKHFGSFRLFEIGHEIHPSGSELPDEIPHLAAALCTKSGDGAASLFELKRVAEYLLPTVELEPAAPRAYEHPARAGALMAKGREIGRLFEFHPLLTETGRAAVLDIDLRLLHELEPTEKRYRPIRRFPASPFDLSIVTAARTPVGSIRRDLAELGGADLAGIEFVREYSGPPLPEGARSVSFRLTAAAPDHTLSSEEMGSIRARIIDGMQARGYDLRL
jgi:phenylalanyl-tRNA synthetase beta chain